MPLDQKSKGRNLFCVYHGKTNTGHSLHLALKIEFAELLKLMKDFNSRILNILFLVSVLRTIYT